MDDNIKAKVREWTDKIYYRLVGEGVISIPIEEYYDIVLARGDYSDQSVDAIAVDQINNEEYR